MLVPLYQSLRVNQLAFRHWLMHIVTAILSMMLVIWAVYRFSIGPAMDVIPVLHQPGMQSNTLINMIATTVQLPAYEWVEGIFSAMQKNDKGHQNPLFASIGFEGTTAFYALSVLFRTPVALMLLWLLPLTMLYKINRLQLLNLSWLTFYAAFAFCMLFVTSNNVAMALRHINPALVLLSMGSGMYIANYWQHFSRITKNLVRLLIAMICLKISLGDIYPLSYKNMLHEIVYNS